MERLGGREKPGLPRREVKNGGCYGRGKERGRGREGQRDREKRLEGVGRE